MGRTGLWSTMGAAATAAALAVLVGAEARAGAWPMPEGHVQSISSVSYDAAERVFGPAGLDDGAPLDFSKVEASVFVEWGVSDRLTLVFQPVAQSVTIETDDGGVESQSGAASSQIGARWLLAEGRPGVFSAQASLVAPGEVENVIDAPLGEGGLAAEARLLAGRGWSGGFLEAQAGYRWRGGEYADELRLDASVGLRPTENWQVIAQSFSTIAAEEIRPDREVESHKAQLSVVRNLTDVWAIQVGARGSYAGRNTVDERGVFVSMWLRRQPGRYLP